MTKLAITICSAALSLAAAAGAAHAFCGFYVNGSGAPMFNDATQVVLVREGTRTTLAMQNDYAGPLTDFAMVVPVPVVLHAGDVTTLPKQVFEHVDSLGSPRLVEYWEQDPCGLALDEGKMGKVGTGVGYGRGGGAGGMRARGVTVEAAFDVDEYKIEILSATDSTGLAAWLQDNHYKIPAGAEPLLRPYVEAGSKFFVAKVDPAKVKVVAGHAALSPLRFAYDSDELALPIRLGMANSSGTQDLIVNVLSPDTRYEVANYPNVTIPTNLDVRDEVKPRFGEFYAALFDATLAAHPGAVVTEYAWDARPGYHCDPCAALDVNRKDLSLLAGDAAGSRFATGRFVLTRLHARYHKGDLADDLRFRAMPPIVGGREDGGGTTALPAAENHFQARYAIRHAWTGAVACASPQRGVWGGPPDGETPSPTSATGIAFASRGGGLTLGTMVVHGLPAGMPAPTIAPAPPAAVTPVPVRPRPDDATAWVVPAAGAVGATMLLGLGGLLLARRPRPR